MISLFSILQTLLVCLVSSLISIFIVERYGSKLNYSELEYQNQALEEQVRSIWKCYRHLAKKITTKEAEKTTQKDQLQVHFSLNGKKFHQNPDCPHLGQEIISTPLDAQIEHFAVNANLFCKSCA